MKLGYFITGTDTGVGKTLVAGALLRQLARRNLSTVGMKPVAAGCEMTASGWINQDVEALRRASTVAAEASLVCPYALPEPVAPHIAAAEAGTHIELAVIGKRFRKLAALADAVVVEGIGGFCVPLSERHDTTDLAALLGLPVILVVGMRLGCLNHALLTAEMIRARGLVLAGWVANQIDPNMLRPAENIAALASRLPCPRIGTISFLHPPNPDVIELKLDV